MCIIATFSPDLTSSIYDLYKKHYGEAEIQSIIEDRGKEDDVCSNFDAKGASSSSILEMLGRVSSYILRSP